MAVKIKQIAKWLKENDLYEIKYELYKKDKRIVFVVSGSENSNLFIVQTMEKGALCVWKMHLLNQEENARENFPTDHMNLPQVMQYALVLDNDRKFGRWEYNQLTEEMVFSVNLLLEDSEMTYKQFRRILGLMLSNATEEAKALRTILETGKIPQSSSYKQLFSLLADFVNKHGQEIEDTEVVES